MDCPLYETNPNLATLKEITESELAQLEATIKKHYKASIKRLALNILKIGLSHFKPMGNNWNGKLKFYDAENKPQYYRDMHYHFFNIFKDRLRTPLLDIACGNYYSHFKPFFQENEIEYYGVDVEKVNPPNTRGLGESLPFGSGLFGSAFIFGSLDHFKDPYQTLKETSRVLKTGGELFIMNAVFPEKNTWLYVDRAYREAHMRTYTINRLKTETEQAGFQTIQLREGYFKNQVYLAAKKTGKPIS